MGRAYAVMRAPEVALVGKQWSYMVGRGGACPYKGLDGGGYLASVFCSPPMAKHQAQTPA